MVPEYPAMQCEQNVDPSTMVLIPSEQVWQLVDDVLLPNAPAAHCIQTVAMIFGLYVPGIHGKQSIPML